MTKGMFLPFETFIKKPSLENRTILVYYGGKSRDADWIINSFPPHWTTLVDVFGGGGAISFRVGMHRKVVVYNDIGNVCNFMKVLRDYPDELYRQLYFTPYSRQEYDTYARNWMESMEKGDQIEWARRWYLCINQGYAHTEEPSPWKVAITVNNGSAFANHTDDLPMFVDRLRRMHIENQDFATLITQYDKPTTLFYCDPPYIHDTRAEGAKATYLNEMSPERHEQLLCQLTGIQGQAVVSGYDHELYNKHLADWRVSRKTSKSSIQNRASLDGREDRTEVLWIKEHHYGLWQNQ